MATLHTSNTGLPSKPVNAGSRKCRSTVLTALDASRLTLTSSAEWKSNVMSTLANAHKEHRRCRQAGICAPT